MSLTLQQNIVLRDFLKAHRNDIVENKNDLGFLRPLLEWLDGGEVNVQFITELATCGTGGFS